MGVNWSLRLSSFGSMEHLCPMLLPFPSENFISQSVTQEASEVQSYNMLRIFGSRASGRKLWTVLKSSVEGKEKPLRTTSKTSFTHNSRDKEALKAALVIHHLLLI